MQNLEHAIRERAYHLWIAAGRPEGHSDAHWLDAQHELLATSVAAPEPAGAAKSKPKLKSAKKSADKPKEKLKAPARSKRKAA